jgi:deoxyribodipyrimidine photolyase-like uncharacterized protein
MTQQPPDPIVSVWILGDQLLAEHPALIAAEGIAGDRARVRVLLVQSLSRTRKLPYQRKKLVLLFSAMRHYAARAARARLRGRLRQSGELQRRPAHAHGHLAARLW